MSDCIAIVGSQDYGHRHLVREFVWTLPKDVVVVSGGARGVDATAACAARMSHLTLVEFHIEVPSHEDFPGDAWAIEFVRRAHARNQQIVDACTRLLAFWDEQSGGTLDTIRRARFKGVPIEIIGKNGLVMAPSKHPELGALWRSTAERVRHERERA